MKKYLYLSLCMLLSWCAACSDSEELENRINFDSPYVIIDDPNDPIQHRRFEIYQKYGVSVFFNDTVAEKEIGTGYDGKPIMQYETLDFNWSFSAHNKDNVKYISTYMNEEDYTKALDFAEAFLAEASKKMRPFSMFFPSTFKIETKDKEEFKKYWVGLRTLVIPSVEKIQGEEQIATFSHDILLSMVKDKVRNAQDIVNAFGDVSDQKYGRPWVTKDNNGGLGCVWGVKHKGTYWKPRELYDEGILKKYLKYNGYYSSVKTEEEFNAERARVFDQIGQHGFICGDEDMDHLYSPKDVKEDLEFFLNTMLKVGEEEFLTRYGNSTMVLKKFNILGDYIKNELGVKF